MSFKSPYRMFPWLRASRDAAMGAVGQTYAQKVLSYGPIAYWPQWETAGLTAECLINSPAQDGTYTGVTLGQPGIGDGNTAPFFDGANDFVDIYSLTLNGAFDGAEGTIIQWVRVNGAGVWTDGAFRGCHTIGANSNNRIYTYKHGNNNELVQGTQFGGAAITTSRTPFSPTAWFCVATTWSIADAEVRFYIDGGSEVVGGGPGVWVGALTDNWTVLSGIQESTPNWHGYDAQCALWDTPLSAAAIADLAVVI